jgi:hypothetical protein
MAVGWALDHFDVIHTFMDDPDGDVQLLGDLPGLHFTARLLRRTIAEDAGKMDGRHVDPLVNHHPHRQGAVQPAG